VPLIQTKLVSNAEWLTEDVNFLRFHLKENTTATDRDIILLCVAPSTSARVVHYQVGLLILVLTLEC
jgi:hypothetical protein